MTSDDAMKTYRNLSGTSNIKCYDITDDGIIVVFKSGSEPHYLYNHLSAGKPIVDQMKKLAAQGRGLCTYISTTVKDRYAKKW
ncbi:hypothetical protein C7417_2256 [Cupriavidus plantarum]|nr:hypothetical protein C7417_2256 [Cupriavidus plantarum]